MPETDGPSSSMAGDNSLELTRSEIDLAKMNFDFYFKMKGTPIDLFELPMLLAACGIDVSP